MKHTGRRGHDAGSKRRPVTETTKEAMSKSDDEAIETLLGCLAVILSFAMMPVTATLRGWVLSILWGWFVASQFGLPALGIAQAIGIALTLGMFTGRARSCKEDEKPIYEEAVGRIVWALLTPPLALGVGWVIRLFL